MLQLQIVVSGRVQGVGYRYFTQMKATQLQITGWTKNRSDGKVEIIATGSKENLDLFIEEIRKGNPFSTVDQIEINQLDNIEKYQSFMIKY
ncbi:acylphosphatase [Mesobacillus maritimus]|uniref:acylphosphatase n=1 Tax=Mesobacillus maritimus TaxID=1643336 RepID=UPI002041140C|nr:acylphosphatase [Mesobacillus maritimus]MCM3585523.1 acylphosphatase [Mesobacillus maritimus]MCM3669783.1 acylphosphatase [Mesobacillus maritimus]